MQLALQFTLYSANYPAFSLLYAIAIEVNLNILDIGVNLTDPMFRGIYHGKQVHLDDLACVLKRAGNVRMIITGTSLSDSALAKKLAVETNQFCTVGTHPTRVSEFELNPDQYLSDLLSLASGPHVVAIGECGLDYDRTQFASIPLQKKYFELQFKLAQETRLPMFFHNRNTGNDFAQMVRENRSSFEKGVVHSFDGNRHELQSLLDLGLYIGINGCSLKTEENLNIVKDIPLDRLMIETDAPWCDIRPTHASFKHLTVPQPLSKKKERFEDDKMVKGRNEPCTISQVLDVICSLKCLDRDETCAKIYQTSSQFFGI